MKDGFYESITILGPGLLGGSLALALQSQGVDVRLWGRREFAVEQARALGVAQAMTSLADAIAETDVIVLSTPIGVMAELTQSVLDLRGGDDAILFTDVGSVKCRPHREMSALLADSPHTFVGGHPMAGSERTGMAAADARLFQDATVVLTPEGEEDDAVECLTEMWDLVGAHSVVMDSVTHDAVVGRLSHFPHVIASLCADVALENSEHSDVSGGGLRDTTRVASGDAKMWAEILTENAEAVISPLQACAQKMGEVLDLLQRKDQEGLHEFLLRAKERRDAL